ncbi:hypothetical protein [Longimicrobium terrae]|uniref:Uncharacterized protein n=1 Tax=Longimicrobium terrae TaxID=1639882 RepID=A0A841H6K6_9BACT|nr:hypothetical protein [Longimicrobium terrae]MBB4639050.1 hypothetical protein [Longimicrobium terrae]MBB6073349.1 hypothetical protein [Longimicrobium terrae]NNC28788.1 hypothetical protein [Longimicrobium terrae]
MTYDTSVFINCPFDAAYRPLFEAVVFATFDCGFHPRCSLEMEDSSQVRIEKINQIIQQSRLAIHDISRTQLDPAFQLPRFNMPLELGIFLGAKAFGSGVQRRKAALVLDVDRYRYQKYISDLAGQDIRAHAEDPETAIHQIRDFLGAHCVPGIVLSGGDLIIERYRAFRPAMAAYCRALRIRAEYLTFRDLTTFIIGWLKANPLPTAV